MAVGNNLAAKPQSMEQKAEFMVAGEKVVLTPQTVRDYLVSGDKERVSIQEIVMFINLCKYAGLNPWLKEAYCIKYGNEPATMVVGKEAFMKRAEKTPGFDGFEAGVIVLSGEELNLPEGNLKTSGGNACGRLCGSIPEGPFPFVPQRGVFRRVRSQKEGWHVKQPVVEEAGHNDPEGCTGAGAA